MQQIQKNPDQAVAPEKIVMEAIARLRMIDARYNGAAMALAPHMLFIRHGDLYISAFNASKNWRSEEERRLGHFKLAGLTGVKLREDGFTPLPDFDGSTPRGDDQNLFAVELPLRQAAA